MRSLQLFHTGSLFLILSTGIRRLVLVRKRLVVFLLTLLFMMSVFMPPITSSLGHEPMRSSNVNNYVPPPLADWFNRALVAGAPDNNRGLWRHLSGRAASPPRRTLGLVAAVAMKRTTNRISWPAHTTQYRITSRPSSCLTTKVPCQSKFNPRSSV